MPALQKPLSIVIALLAFLQPFGHGHSHAELAGHELRWHLVLYHGNQLTHSAAGWHYHPIVLSGQCSPSPRAEQTDELGQPSLSIWNALEGSCKLPCRIGPRRLHIDCGRTHHEMPCVLLI